jgi:hypothetical protein
MRAPAYAFFLLICDQGKPHGSGVFTFTDFPPPNRENLQNRLKGATLSGNCFVHGVAQGFGELRRDHCDVYSGEFEAGLMHGTGRWFKTDGSIHHDGRFERGKMLRSRQDSGSCSLQ